MDKDEYRRSNNKSYGNNQSKYKDLDNDWDQLSNKLGKKITDIENEDTFFQEVNSSLARQVSIEMEDKATNKRIVKKRKKYKVLKIFAIIFSVIMLIAGFLMFTSPGRKILLNIAGKYIYQHLNYQSSDALPVSDDDYSSNTNEIDEPIDDIVNILLLGVEEIEGASNTDVMIIATMNTKEKTIKLTSLMRDLYVEIPGYNNNKLNSVYAKEGIGLLYDTIENNFGIRPDGYVKVNFDVFEQIVDLIGGVEITLTSNEAHYLNTTNYISDPANRNVVAGTQIVNGNQAVGYCRVRKVSTGTENNDFGRTQRQRAVLKSIFDKVKSKNIVQLGLLMNSILSIADIDTDITQTKFNRYLEEAVNLKANDLENLRIPTDGSFANEKVQIGSYRQEVLVPTDWDATREEIRQFIYGDDTEDNNTSESIDLSSDSTEE